MSKRCTAGQDGREGPFSQDGACRLCYDLARPPRPCSASRPKWWRCNRPEMQKLRIAVVSMAIVALAPAALAETPTQGSPTPAKDWLEKDRLTAQLSLQCLDDLSPERWERDQSKCIRPLVYCQCQGEHVVGTLTDQEIAHPDSIRMEKLVDAESKATSICLEILKPSSR